MSHFCRFNALTEIPLPVLLRQLTEAMTGRARIPVHLNADGNTPDRRLPSDVQVGLYRIAQEALNNVAKHANATQAVVALHLGETVRLTVADDGTGFDPGTIGADHLGLRILRERAEAISARFGLSTVKYHISNILGKPGVDNRVAAVTLAMQRKLV